MKRYFLLVLMTTLTMQSYGQGLIIEDEENKPSFDPSEKHFFFKEKTKLFGKKPILHTAKDSLALYIFKRNKIITVIHNQNKKSTNYALEFMNISDILEIECHRNQKMLIITHENDGNDSIMNIELDNELVYNHLWDGVKVVFYKNKNIINYDFHIAPNTDPKIIQFEITNINGLKINDTGMMEIITSLGVFQKNKPKAYQENGNEKIMIESHYKIKEKVIYFQVGTYDITKKLVISNLGLLKL
jgi:hypothetical protein